MHCLLMLAWHICTEAKVVGLLWGQHARSPIFCLLPGVPAFVHPAPAM